MSIPLLGYANPITNILPRSSTVNSQGEALKNKQETKSELQQKQNQLLRDIDALNIEVQELERQEQEFKNKITGLNESIKNLSQVNTRSGDQSVSEQKIATDDSLKKELDETQIALVEVQKQLTEKQGTLEANREAIIKLDTQIQEAAEAVEVQKDQFFDSILGTIRQYTPSIAGVLIGIMLYLITKRINNKYTPPAIKDLVSVIINIVYVLGIGIMTTYLFIGQFGNIFTLLSLFSAALVVALQDFVSSFFAWIFIKARNKFKVGDIIQIAGFSGNNQYSGKVKKIEAFRTLLIENEGTMEGEKMDKELAEQMIKRNPERYRFSTRFLWFPREISGKIYWLKSVPVLEYKTIYRDVEPNVDYFSWDVVEWFSK
jgi:predicted HicB family RNase H-like nuclease